jgi:hypothetical protein
MSRNDGWGGGGTPAPRSRSSGWSQDDRATEAGKAPEPKPVDNKKSDPKPADEKTGWHNPDLKD